MVKKLQKVAFATVGAALSFAVIEAKPAQAAGFSLEPLGTYATGLFDEGAAEISAYDSVTQRLFVTNANSNSIDILSISDPTQPSLFSSIDLSPYGGSVNSVTFKNGFLAAAVEANVTQDPGSVVFFNASGGFLNSVTVGALPDMLTFTPDGTKILVANEGEPNGDYTADPEGSVSIIDLTGGVTQATVRTAGFTQFNNTLLDPSIRIFGPGSSVAQDLEPEYIAVSADSSKAWITLQENNALGLLDLDKGEFTELVGLGFKDHSLPGNGLDASDRDGTINIANLPVFGLYQPDAIASYTVAGKTYLVTANEGDARDYDAFAEEERIKDLTLDPTAFPNAAELQEDEVLGRLTVTSTLGDPDGDGDYDALYAFGGRSFSIWDEKGKLIFDSGDAFEQITAKALPDFFNSDNTENNFDNRSDNKGPEPEGVTIAEIDGRTFALVGLERIGGILVYDITDPTRPVFVNYTNNRDFLGDPEAGTAGDLGPEGLLFIAAQASPNGKPLLAVTNEVSGTTTLYSVKAPAPAVDVPEPGVTVALGGLAAAGVLARRRSRKQQGM